MQSRPLYQEEYDDSYTAAPTRRKRSNPFAGLLDIMHLAEERMPYAVGWLISAGFWLIGARYTVDGTPLLLNFMLHFLHIPLRVPTIDGYWYLPFLVLPYYVSRVEVGHGPLRRVSGRWAFAPFRMILIWLLVTGFDLATTYMSASVPPVDAWSITKKVAEVVWFLAIWVGFLTFWPEWSMAFMKRKLQGK